MDTQDTPRRKIIYVDDIQYGLLTVKNMLKARYEVYPAQSVARMYDVLLKVRPDLIILDVNMPEVNGYEAIQQLKGDARYSEIPVIFLTGQSDKDSVFKGLNLGAVAYVNKPFTPQFLIEQIESVFTSEKNKNPFADLLMNEEDSDKPRILAIDDVSVMLRTIQFALRDLYNVYTLTQPEELEMFLRNIKPDLFLLDYNMPGLNGFDLIPIIRKFPEHKETPIIFVTADGTVDQMTAAASLGARDFIVKPINKEILRAKIAKHLNKDGGEETEEQNEWL